MSIRREGILGEQLSYNFLTSLKYFLFQPDWIIKTKDGGPYYLVEVKNQYLYDTPDFKGHGLPPSQVVSRLKFQEHTGVIAVLLVRDKGTHDWYWGRLDFLERSSFIITPGKKRIRKIYPISAFKKYSVDTVTGLYQRAS